MYTKTLLALGIAALLAIVPANAGAYTPLTDDDGDEIEPNPYITGNVTIANHKAACADDVLCFHDDADDVSNLADYGFGLNTGDVSEPIQFKPQGVDCQYYAENVDAKSTTSGWCANISDKSWLDTSNWVTTSGEANDTFARVLRNGAHALHIRNPGVNPGTVDADTYALDFTDISSDPTKQRLLIGIEVVAIGRPTSNAFLVQVWDTTAGRWNNFRLVDDGTATNGAGTGVIANSTGVTFWDPIATEGEAGGGGITNGISKIHLEPAADSAVGPTEVYVYALALQVKRYELGRGSDAEPVYNMTYTGCDGVARSAPLGYACLADFAPSFTYQTAKDIKLAYVLKASTLPETAVGLVAGETNDDSYPWRTNYEFTFDLPKMIDLTYAGDEALKYTLPVGGSQHDSVSAGGTDKTKDIEKKKIGDTVTLTTAVANKKTEAEFTILFTDAQMLQTTETGFLGLPSSNPLSKLWNWLAGLAVIGGVFAVGLRRGRRGGR